VNYKLRIANYEFALHAQLAGHSPLEIRHSKFAE